MPDYFAHYLNSYIGKTLVEQLNSGGIQTNLTIPVIESIPVVLPDKETQSAIVDLLEATNKKESESIYLLALAREAVELAIEEDEGAALRLIEKGTDGVA